MAEPSGIEVIEPDSALGTLAKQRQDWDGHGGDFLVGYGAIEPGPAGGWLHDYVTVERFTSDRVFIMVNWSGLKAQTAAEAAAFARLLGYAAADAAKLEAAEVAP